MVKLSRLGIVGSVAAIIAGPGCGDDAQAVPALSDSGVESASLVSHSSDVASSSPVSSPLDGGREQGSSSAASEATGSVTSGASLDGGLKDDSTESDASEATAIASDAGSLDAGGETWPFDDASAPWTVGDGGLERCSELELTDEPRLLIERYEGVLSFAGGSPRSGLYELTGLQYAPATEEDATYCETQFEGMEQAGLLRISVIDDDTWAQESVLFQRQDTQSGFGWSSYVYDGVDGRLYFVNGTNICFHSEDEAGRVYGHLELPAGAERDPSTAPGYTVIGSEIHFIDPDDFLDPRCYLVSTYRPKQE